MEEKAKRKRKKKKDKEKEEKLGDEEGRKITYNSITEKRAGNWGFPIGP